MLDGFDGRAQPERPRTPRAYGPARIPSAPRSHDRPSPSRRPDTSEQPRRDLDWAVNGLRGTRPDLSAGAPMARWQRWAIIVLLPSFAALAILAPDRIVLIVASLLALPFSCVVALRSAALWRTLKAPRQPGHVPHAAPAALPRYSILVPLYDEANVVPDLLAALAAIDYPKERLEIFLALEESDSGTRKAVEAALLPPHIAPVVVPDGQPRTKPRALNYVLPRTTGDLIVIYDAEDLPEPDQLRRAATALAARPDLGCVQASLNVLNVRELWLTRQFAIEYTVLFDCMLPALERLKLPVPLGGTSNHFTRRALEQVGAWDSFNVTEDADLGIRLARSGWGVGTLTSTTWEEAPANFSTWIKQRTRWLKGWMQTYLVHMRSPARTARDMGWRQFAGFQVLMGGLVLSALVHPWFYLIAAAEVAFGPLSTLGSDAVSRTLWIVTTANLVLGYLSGVTLGCVAVAGRGHRGLAGWALMMPMYWLLISIAAYRAIYQLAFSPYGWEKTQHRPRAEFSNLGEAEADRTPSPPRIE